MTPNTYTYIAVDIAKDTLEVQTPREHFRCSNNPEGYAQLCRRLAGIKNAMVVYEATGGYERNLMEELFKRNIPQARLNPARVRAFAQSEGIKAKNDRLDARMILRYAQEKRPVPARAAAAERQQMADLLDRRSQLTEQLAREKNRLQKAPSITRKSIRHMIKLIEREIARIDAQIESIIQAHEQLKWQSDTLQSIQGIGAITAWSILAYLWEIDQLNRNQTVALVGLAPFDKDSATIRKKRTIQAGRAKVRKCLYMAAQSAARFNPVIKAYVQRHRAREKPYRWLMTAAMRKLLIHIHSLLKNPQPTLAS